MNLEDLKGIGPTRISRMRAVGIHSLRDLLYFFPVRYEDHIHETPVAEACEGEKLIRGIVADTPRIAYFHGRSRVSAMIRDGSGSLAVYWFNEPWMKQQLPIGKEILLYGRIQNRNSRRSMLNPRIVTRQEWMPVYRPIRGFPAKTFYELIDEALSAVEEICPETLPRSFRDRYSLIGLHDALRWIHFPENTEQLTKARRRLDFENNLIYLMGVSIFRQQKQPGFPFAFSSDAMTEFWDKNPFPPTGAQRRVLEEIASDLRQDTAMARLVQGDVGSGKTILAFSSIFLAWKSDYQAAMMAPTEILARQHYENAISLLEPLGIHCRLLTGSTRAAERKKILKELKEGSCNAVFGTHALISTGVDFARLGLVVTDEQHRFGVLQRSALQAKGDSPDRRRSPHVLVMSATPIPRTLALILYGDLNLSLVDEMPPGRQPVKTRIVPEEKRAAMYQFLREKIREGQQAYIVCPMVEDSEVFPDVRSAQTMYRELTGNELKEFRLGLTWGAQKNEEKARTLQQFARGELDVLVATSVIEVGINVPDATVMIIENAERYGLSQLHQLRGRVGRGSRESWCFLMSKASQKLKILCDTGDGFLVAQKDLELRGPGDLMGTRQSGDALQHPLQCGNVMLLDEVQKSVHELISDPALLSEKKQIEALTRSVFSGEDFHVALN